VHVTGALGSGARLECRSPVIFHLSLAWNLHYILVSLDMEQIMQNSVHFTKTASLLLGRGAAQRGTVVVRVAKGLIVVNVR